jgi:hypothetical protein
MLVTCRHAYSKVTVNKLMVKIQEIPSNEQSVYNGNGALSS